MDAMSDPLTASDDLAARRSAAAVAWTVASNWDGDDYIGPGLPPWGTRNRCPVIRNQRRCRKACIPGGAVCNTHGGAAPQVKRRAALRLMSLIDPAISTLAREMVQADKSADRQRAANSLLDRAGVGRSQGDIDANTAKAVLMERYHALRETVARERAEAGEPPLEVEWLQLPEAGEPSANDIPVPVLPDELDDPTNDEGALPQ